MDDEHSTRMVTIAAPFHGHSLAEGLWELLTSKHNLDFELTLGGRTIRTHRLLVDVFLSPELTKRTVDANDHQYSRQADPPSDQHIGGVQVLPCVSGSVADCLEPLVEFMYRGRVTVEEHRLEAMRQIAEELDFKLLAEAARETEATYDAPASAVAAPPSPASSASSPDDAGMEDDENDADFDVRRPQALPAAARRRGGARRRGRWPIRKPVKTAVGKAEVGKKMELRNKMRHRNRVVKRDDLSTRSQYRVVLTSGDGDFDAEAVNGDGEDDEEEALSADEEQKLSRERARRRMYSRRRRQLDGGGGCGRVAKVAVDPNQIHQCQHCEYKCRNQNRMRIHQAKHDPNIDVHRCELCSRGFLSTDKLARHLAKHTTNKCPHCEFETSRPTAYYQHLYSRHKVNSVGQPLQQSCPACDFKCVMPSQLRRHWTRKHTTEKPFRCELCQYSSVTKEDVNKHVRRIHLALKPFTCDICNHSTATRYHLNRHRQTHVVANPPAVDPFGQPLAEADVIKIYVCHVCGHSCNRQDNLRVHIKNVHKLAV